MKQFMSGTGRVWRAIVALALLATTVAVTPATAGAQAEPADDTQAVQFTIENLQPEGGFFFTEAWVGLHNGDFDLFNNGVRATPGLEALAEGGNTELLGAEFAAAGRLQTTVGNGEVQFISPGEVIEGSIDIRNASAYRYASFASMIIPSNDAFFGNEDPLAYEVFDADGNPTGDIVIDILASDIYDAGTEVNDGEGAAGFSLGLNGDGGTSTDDTTSTVGIHPDLLENILGFQTAAGADITDPLTLNETEGEDELVARITISVGPSLRTVSAVGPAFDGSVPADFSDDAAAPTAVQLDNGSNVIANSVVAGDIDYVTVNVPDGHVLGALELLAYDSDGDNVRSFIGIQEGTVFTEAPDTVNPANLLGLQLFGEAEAGTDILGSLGEAANPFGGPGGIGFEGALPAGDYTFWIQETSENAATYYLDLQVSPDSLVCAGHVATVNLSLGDAPTDGDDVILGTDGDDVINGLGGNDVICGEGGNDTINAGNGADTVFGGAGADVINAGQGRDTVYGQGGDDFVSGGRGKDTIVGGGGDDDLRGNNGTDTISGGAGNDAINGGQKADALNGDNGDDTIVGGTRPDTIDGGNGADILDGGGSDFDTCVEDAGDADVVSCEILS